MTSRREVLSQLGFLSILGSAVVASKRPLQAQNVKNCEHRHTDQTSTGEYLDSCINTAINYTVEEKWVTSTCQNADGSVTYKTHVEFHGTAYGVDPVSNLPNGTQYVMNYTSLDKGINQPYTAGAYAPFTETQHIDLSVVSKGSGPNTKMGTTITYSGDSSCNLTISTKFDHEQCNG